MQILMSLRFGDNLQIDRQPRVKTGRGFDPRGVGKYEKLKDLR